VLLEKVGQIYRKKPELTYERCIDKLQKLSDHFLAIADLAQLSFEKNIYEKEKLKVV